MKSPEQLAEERYPYKPSEGGMAATAYAREIVDLKREAYAAGLREGAQGIVKEGENKPVVTHLNMDPNASPEVKAAVADMVHAAYSFKPKEVKEGPSVEDIMEVVEAWRKQHDMGELPYMVDDLRTRLSALFTQTQVEPGLVEHFKGAVKLLERMLPILERAESDPNYWLPITAGSGVATLNYYRHFLASAKAIAADTPQAEGRGVEAESAVPVSGACGSETSPKQS